MNYVRVIKDRPKTKPNQGFFRTGVIYSLREKSQDYKYKGPIEYEYIVHCQSKAGTFPQSWVTEFPEYFKEVTREEIDKMKEGVTPERLELRSYYGDPIKGVWITEPYNYFIPDGE